MIMELKSGAFWNSVSGVTAGSAFSNNLHTSYE